MTMDHRPRTPHALHAWIESTLGVRLCRQPLIDGHQAPMDYILHTFFEGDVPEDNADGRGQHARGQRDSQVDRPCPDQTDGRFDRAEPSEADASGRTTRLESPSDSDGLDPVLPAAHLLNGRATTPHAPNPSASRTPHPPDIVLWANRGGGKTFLGAIATVLDMVFKPGIQVRILAGSLEQASRMLDHLRRFFCLPDLADMVAGRITQRRIALTNASEVEILAASEASVRGTRVQKLRCDEVDLFDPALWDAAQLTTRSAVCGGVHVRGSVECLSTMHRPHGLMFRLVKECTQGARRLLKWGVVDTLEDCGPQHHCQSDAGDCPLLPECAGRAKRSDQPSGLEPIARAIDLRAQRGFDHTRDRPDERPDGGHITIADALTMKSRVSVAVWEAEMLCLRPSRGHAVFPEFDVRRHVVRDTPREGVTWYAGMDFGFRAPTVILWGALDEAGVLWIADEHVRAETLLDEHIRVLRESERDRAIPRPKCVAADPAGRQRHEQTGVSNFEAIRRAGLPVVGRIMSIGEGLALMHARLNPASGMVRLLIHERCNHLIESLERYHYPEDDPESMVPVKDGHDHAVDALRYLVACIDRPGTVGQGGYLNGG